MCEAKSGFCLGMSLLTLGSILLCILCSEKIPSYLATKDFKRTTCVVDNTVFYGNVCCDISQPSDLSQCSKVYPCYKTQVQYDDVDGQTQTGIIYEDHETFSYQKDNPQCSFYECGLKTYDQFWEEAQGYLEGDGAAGVSRDCGYDPTDLSVAFVETTSVDWVVHSVLWPMIIIIVGIVVTIISCIIDPETNFGNDCYRRCGGKYEDSEKGSRVTIEVVQGGSQVVIVDRDRTMTDLSGKYDYDAESFEEGSRPSAGSTKKSKDLLKPPAGDTLDEDV